MWSTTNVKGGQIGHVGGYPIITLSPFWMHKWVSYIESRLYWSYFVRLNSLRIVVWPYMWGQMIDLFQCWRCDLLDYGFGLFIAQTNALSHIYAHVLFDRVYGYVHRKVHKFLPFRPKTLRSGLKTVKGFIGWPDVHKFYNTWIWKIMQFFS